MSPRVSPGPVVTGAPYSAQRVSEHVQVAADGTRFTTTNQQETTYRDSQGRTRTERSMPMSPSAPESPLVIEISDPVANVGYTLDTQNRVAHRYTYSVPAMRQSGVIGGLLNRRMAGAEGVAARAPAGAIAAQTPEARPRPEISHEELGPEIIEGVMATGQRTVQTWATGAQGNDRPFQVISENWFSPDLKLTVLNKNSDPRSGEYTTRLINVSRAEPDPSLFAPPPDYKIIDESGPFEIQWSNGPRQ